MRNTHKATRSKATKQVPLKAKQVVGSEEGQQEIDRRNKKERETVRAGGDLIYNRPIKVV